MQRMTENLGWKNELLVEVSGLSISICSMVKTTIRERNIISIIARAGGLPVSWLQNK